MSTRFVDAVRTKFFAAAWMRRSRERRNAAFMRQNGAPEEI
jgi:hypothetical protein